MFGKVNRLPFVGEIFYCGSKTLHSKRMIVCYRNVRPVSPFLICGDEVAIIGEYNETNLIGAIRALGLDEKDCYIPESYSDTEPNFVREMRQ